MTRLEQCFRYTGEELREERLVRINDVEIENQTFLLEDQVLDAAKLDNENAYQRGVEDVIANIEAMFLSRGLPGTKLMVTQEKDRFLNWMETQRLEALKNG